MEAICNIGTAILLGIFDSIRGIAVIFYLDKEANKKAQAKHVYNVMTPARSKEMLSADPPQMTTNSRQSANKENAEKRKDEYKVLNRVFQCCMLNGGVFLMSILFFECLLLPSLNYFLSYLFDSNSSTMPTVWSWMQPSLSLLFDTLWVAPLFLLSKIVNSLWFQDIADSAYKFRKGRPQLMPSFSKLIADTLISLLIQILFLVQSTIIKFLPFPAPIKYGCMVLYMIHMSMLCALYAFEYKWFNMGWELHKRLTYIESNWPYFIGFGLTLAALSELPSSYSISGCVFSVLFPLFILSANEATPRIGITNSPLRLFSPVVAITNAIFSSRTKLGKAVLDRRSETPQPSPQIYSSSSSLNYPSSNYSSRRYRR